MPYETIANVMLMTGQRAFGAIGFMAVIAALLL